MSTGTTHRGQSITAVVKDSGVSVGLLQGGSLNIPPEYETLTGGGTNKVVDVQQTLVEPSLDTEFGTWDNDAFEALANFDDVSGKLSDTAEPPQFDIEIKIPATDGDTDTEVVLLDARPDTTINLDPDSFGTIDLSFTGQDLQRLADYTA